MEGLIHLGGGAIEYQKLAHAPYRQPGVQHSWKKKLTVRSLDKNQLRTPAQSSH